MDITIIYQGTKHDICFVSQDGRSHVGEFIKGLEDRDQKRVFALLRRTADHGLPHNDEKFHKLKGIDIYEFKSFQVRLFCFRDESRLIIVTHGFVKKGDSTPKGEITRAVNIKKQFLEERKRKEK